MAHLVLLSWRLTDIRCATAKLVSMPSIQHHFYSRTKLLCCSASLKKILNLNETIPQDENDDPHSNSLAPVGPILTAEGDPIWKVLVFDDLGRDVISSVLRVSDLRAMGVTMHMYVYSTFSIEYINIYTYVYILPES